MQNKTPACALLPALSSCMVNFSDPEGYIDSSDDPPLPDGAFLHCTYTVTVYTGYGVELQVCAVHQFTPVFTALGLRVCCGGLTLG